MGAGVKSFMPKARESFWSARSWGPLRKSLGNRLLMFEDPNGIIRIVDVTAANPSTKMLQVERILTRR